MDDLRPEPIPLGSLRYYVDNALDDQVNEALDNFILDPQTWSPKVTQISLVSGYVDNSRTIPYAEFHSKVVDALTKAIVHANEVCVRDHIKANRIERVNVFITDLRRELSSQWCYSEDSVAKKLVMAVVCRKEAWYDLGVIQNNPLGRWGIYKHDNGACIIMTETVIRTLLAEADCRTPVPNNLAEDIKNDLRHLNAMVSGFDNHITVCQHINSEADKLIDKLCVLVDRN